MSPRKRITRLLRDESGEAVIATVIAWTILIPLLAAVFQAALWYAARNTALTAARHGAAVARDQGSSLGTGIGAACGFATTTGHGFLLGPACTGSGGTTITITVTGHAPTFIPFFSGAVTETVTGPAERFVPFPGGQP